MSSEMTDLCFLPLDIPPIKQKQSIVERFNQFAGEQYIWWNREILLGEANYRDPIGSYKSDWSERAIHFFPTVIDTITRHIPFKQIYYVHLARALEEILPHVDENYEESPLPKNMSITTELKRELFESEPVGFRFIIQGNRRSFYLCKKYDPTYKSVIHQARTYCYIPDSTDFYLIRNGEPPHGVAFDPDSPRLTGFVLASVQPKAHIDLINRSLARYREHARFRSDIN